MNPLLKKILTPLASLRITVLLLLGTMLLVYVGTLAQQTKDNYTVQKEYFHSWLVYMPLANHIPFGNLNLGGGYMFLGGYSLIVGILVNLIAAHWLRFKFVVGDLLLVPVLVVAGYLTWLAQDKPNALLVTLTSLAAVAALALTFRFHGKRTGVIIIHFGLILILTGELVTSLFRGESQMTLIEGDTQNWTQDVQRAELAVIDPSPADHDRVIAVPAGKLPSAGSTLSDSRLPFDVRIDAYYPNASLKDGKSGSAEQIKPTTGRGTTKTIVPLRLYTGTGEDAGKVNAPAAYVTVLKGGKPVETLMLSAVLYDAQRITVEGKPFDIALRFQRFYKPYSINLIDFKHEKYEGTSKAKNFAAHLRLLDPANSVDREVTVRMNQPMRYAGDTIYQSGFDPENPKVSTLQVVRNPGWLLPYIACAVGGLGMTIHFGITLLSFLDRQIVMPKNRGILIVSFVVGGLIGVVIDWATFPLSIFNVTVSFLIAGVAGSTMAWIVILYSRQRARTKATPVLTVLPHGAYTLEPQKRSLGWVLPAALAALAVFYAVVHALPRDPAPPNRKDYALEQWGRLPINFDGRVMPLDSLARNSLKVIYGKQTFTITEKDPATNKDVSRKAQAIEWLADTMSGAARTRDLKVIRIDEPQVKAFFNLPIEEKDFSYSQLLPDPDPIMMQPPSPWQAVAPSQFELVRYQINELGTALVSVSEMPDQAEMLVQNLVRWAGQVGLPPPNPETLASQISMAKLGGGTARRFDFSGPGNGESPPLRSIVVVGNRMKKTYVVKIIGLTDAINDAELARFNAFVDSVRFNERMEKLGNELQRASAKREADKNSLDLFDRKLLELGSHISLFNRLAQPRSLYAVAPLAPGQQWRTLNEARIAKRDTLSPEPAMENFIVSTAAWRDGQGEEFNKAVTAYHKLLEQSNPDLVKHANFETFYNRFSPFWVSVGLYIFVFVLGCVSWMFLGGPLARGALAVLIISFLIHTFGLASRVYISGRPPVTNLYSSAVFISWVVVLVSIFIERIFKNGLAVVMAGLVGFMSLFVADGIEFVDAVSRSEGDTMAQLQAVLDTNFWLATHVVMITMGYAATFLAGKLAIFYILGGLVSRFGSTLPDGRQGGLSAIFNGPLGRLTSEQNRKLTTRMIYGVLCFAMLLSFVGTILGGIWADQSWGRFWGWDSKENGAILIVLWIAVILHARWSGMIKEQGMMSLAIIGNIVTAWSWFGTNELGIGLHSYGFTEGVVPRLLAYWGAMAALAILAATPIVTWRNFKWIGEKSE